MTEKEKLEPPILIVGQGIVGSILALRCILRKIPFKIIDDGHKTSSSLAAAGLFNPFILKRRKLAWKAEEFMPEAMGFYHELNSLIQGSFFHDVGILRRIHNAEEYNGWTAMKGESFPFVGDIHPEIDICDQLESTFGFQEILSAGYVDTVEFLRAAKILFKDIGAYEQDVFEEEQLITEDTLSFRGVGYSKVIICTGYVAMNSPRLFPDLPFTPAKGHTMEIFCPDLKLDRIVNGPCFIIPKGRGCFRIGSTYSWQNFNEETETEETEKLKKMFESYCSLPYEVREVWAGVRPATKDRRPLIGTSDKDLRIWLLGGFGSRAIMTAPLLTKMFIDHLFHDAELWPEICLQRYG